jgi:predicted dehydrogenase
MAKGLCFKRRLSIGKSPNGPVPPGVDYSTWLGPAPMRPFNPNRFHYNWHWFWDTGNGDIGNQGVHEMDLARWGLGVKLPKAVSSTGGKYVYDDDQETPNTQIATYDYGDKQLMFEVRGLPTGNEANMNPAQGPTNAIGAIYFGEDGYMTLDDLAYQVYKGEKLERVDTMKYQEPRTSDTNPHMRNFIASVKSRKHTDLNSDIEEGHYSAALCHLANVSYRVGRKLNFDPATEKFVGDNEANKLLTREYRKPFVVPERV